MAEMDGDEAEEEGLIDVLLAEEAREHDVFGEVALEEEGV